MALLGANHREVPDETSFDLFYYTTVLLNSGGVDLLYIRAALTGGKSKVYINALYLCFVVTIMGTYTADAPHKRIKKTKKRVYC